MTAVHCVCDCSTLCWQHAQPMQPACTPDVRAIQRAPADTLLRGLHGALSGAALGCLDQSLLDQVMAGATDQVGTACMFELTAFLS